MFIGQAVLDGGLQLLSREKGAFIALDKVGGSETGTLQTSTLTFWEFSDIFLFVRSHLLPL